MNADRLQQLLDKAAAVAEADDFEQALELLETALTEPSPLPGEPHVQQLRQTARERFGHLLHRIGKQDDALDCYRQLQQEALTTRQRIHALTLMGNQLRHMGRLGEAQELLHEALQMAQQQDDDLAQSLAYQGLGGVSYAAGQLEEAVAHLEKSMPGLVRAGDREQQFRTRNRQGFVYMRLGKTDEGIAAFQSALKQARLINVRATMIALNNLGEAHQHMFDMQQALAYHQEAMQLAKGKKLKEVPDLLRNLGMELIYLNSIEQGLAYLYQALDVCEETGQIDVQQQTLYSLALAEIENGQLEVARKHAQQLQDVARSNNARTYEADALHALGLCCKLQGDRATAEQYWQQASFLAHETEQRMLLWQVHAELAGIAADPGLAAVHRRIAAEVIEQIAYPVADKELRAKFLDSPPVQAVLSQLEN